jgi:hypothetical protein
MQAIDLIRSSLEMTDHGIGAIVEGLRDAPLTQPIQRDGVGRGNHPLWIMGHLAYIEGTLSPILTGEPNPVAHWASSFAPGTHPKADASLYPPFDEVFAKYRELRKQTLTLLTRIGDAGLDQPPKHIPPGFEAAMRTVGHTFMIIALHQMVHYGQLADARRVAGLPPLM